MWELLQADPVQSSESEWDLATVMQLEWSRRAGAYFVQPKVDG